MSTAFVRGGKIAFTTTEMVTHRVKYVGYGSYGTPKFFFYVTEGGTHFVDKKTEQVKQSILYDIMTDTAYWCSISRSPYAMTSSHGLFYGTKRPERRAIADNVFTKKNENGPDMGFNTITQCNRSSFIVFLVEKGVAYLWDLDASVHNHPKIITSKVIKCIDFEYPYLVVSIERNGESHEVFHVETGMELTIK